MSIILGCEYPTYRFRLSSSISLYVLQLSSINAATIKVPPRTAAGDNFSFLYSQSTITMRKIVSRAATEDRTGDVKEMSTRKDPEKVAFASVDISSI